MFSGSPSPQLKTTTTQKRAVRCVGRSVTSTGNGEVAGSIPVTGCESMRCSSIGRALAGIHSGVSDPRMCSRTVLAPPAPALHRSPWAGSGAQQLNIVLPLRRHPVTSLLMDCADSQSVLGRPRSEQVSAAMQWSSSQRSGSTPVRWPARLPPDMGRSAARRHRACSRTPHSMASPGYLSSGEAIVTPEQTRPGACLLI